MTCAIGKSGSIASASANASPTWDRKCRRWSTATATSYAVSACAPDTVTAFPCWSVPTSAPPRTTASANARILYDTDMLHTEPVRAQRLWARGPGPPRLARQPAPTFATMGCTRATSTPLGVASRGCRSGA
jgi:hypothetical protein